MSDSSRFFFVCCFALLTGCVAREPSCQPALDELNAKFSSLTHKFEFAKQENFSLKRELSLFRKNYNIDSRLFILALDAFSRDFRDEIAVGVVSAEVTDRGMVITLLSEHLFASASDALSEAGRSLLDKIASFVGVQFASHYIYVEGHTDNQSLAVFEWKSDWDFSFARALSIVKYLTEKKGMDPLRFSASGFGQYRPRASQETKEGRRLNRRIELIISPQRPQTLSR